MDALGDREERGRPLHHHPPHVGPAVAGVADQRAHHLGDPAAARGGVDVPDDASAEPLRGLLEGGAAALVRGRLEHLREPRERDGSAPAPRPDAAPRGRRRAHGAGRARDAGARVRVVVMRLRGSAMSSRRSTAGAPVAASGNPRASAGGRHCVRPRRGAGSTVRSGPRGGHERRLSHGRLLHRPQPGLARGRGRGGPPGRWRRRGGAPRPRAPDRRPRCPPGPTPTSSRPTWCGSTRASGSTSAWRPYRGRPACCSRATPHGRSARGPPRAAPTS